VDVRWHPQFFLDRKTTVDLESFIHEYIGAWNAHALERIRASYHSDYQGLDVNHARPILGADGAARVIAGIFMAFPDSRLECEPPLVQKDRVAVAWTMHGTQNGPVMNIPPTGRKVQVRGMSMLTVQGGKITRASHVWDVAGLLRTIGLLPDLE
jgi:steroid delta-isomerase-like uncharacterized protein